MVLFGCSVLLRRLSLRLNHTNAFNFGELVFLARHDLPKALEKLSEARLDHDIPDWGMIKIASQGLSTTLKIEEVNKLLQSHYNDTGAGNRLARKANVTEDQVIAALNRILQSQNGLEKSIKFYKMLIDLKFCTNKDRFILPIVACALEKNGLNETVHILNELLEFGRVKSLAITLCTLQRSSYSTSNENDKTKVFDFITKYAKSSKDWVVGFVMFENGHGVRWAEDIYSRKINLTAEGVRYMCMLAKRLKSTEALNEMLKLSSLLKLDTSAKVQIYEHLIQIYGKRAELNDLERIGEQIALEENREEYTKSLYQIKHFYKCADRQPSEKLLKIIRDI